MRALLVLGAHGRGIFGRVAGSWELGAGSREPGSGGRGAGDEGKESWELGPGTWRLGASPALMKGMVGR